MSRARATEVSTPLSLFPFIGVLLSTMGALLVVLIAVSRSARDSALRDVASQRAAAEQAQTPADSGEAGRKLQKVNDYVARLNDVRSQAERQLRDDQLRLSHIEEHMRRMQDQLAQLRAAATELDAIDEEHLDDRKQAEREVERLRQLITDTRATVDSLKKTGPVKKRSFAIIPYDGPNATRRRPIYIECRKDDVIVQPEGIRLTDQDFIPPLDSGNPLAAVLRAAREELVRGAGAGLPNKQAEPYPLILIRPDGIEAYYAVREAIASWDADFGYEFVGADWKLEFQSANPQLAKSAQQALEQARIRRRVLAAAAPRAFRSGSSFGSGEDGLEADDDNGTSGGDFNGGYGDGSGGYGTGSGTGSGVGSGGYVAGNGAGRSLLPRGMGGSSSSGTVTSQPITASGASGNGNGGPAADAVGSTATSHGRGSGDNRDIDSTGSTASTNTGQGGEPAGAPIGSGTASGPVAGGSPLPGPGGGRNGATSAPAASSDGQMGSAMGSGNFIPPMRPDQPHPLPERITPEDLANAKSGSWALGPKSPAAVPVRRSIQVIVRDDRIAILPESGAETAGGREVPLSGPMKKNLDEIVSAVQKHVGEWGMAGQGLYWRPVLVLHVGPDGSRRADELTRLLKDSGIELRTSAATQQAGGPTPDRR